MATVDQALADARRKFDSDATLAMAAGDLDPDEWESIQAFADQDFYRARVQAQAAVEHFLDTVEERPPTEH